MTSYKTQAIIINRLNLGESDRILTLFSRDKGKFRAICKGGRKTKSKFGGHTELFSLVDFVITEGKNLDIITDANLLHNYLAVNPDMDKIKTAYYFAEVLNKLLPDDSENSEIFDLYEYCLSNIYKLDENLLQITFVSKLLKNFGIYPELTNCVKCEKKPNKESVYFSKTAGGVLDKSCSLHFQDAICVNEKMIKLWRYLENSPLTEISKLSVDIETIVATAELTTSYLHSITMIDYRSLRVLS